MRLDQYLTQHKLCHSRSKAKELIEQGVVMVDGLTIKTPSKIIQPSQLIELKGDPSSFVSRSAYKLQFAINQFQIDLKDKIVLDVGASTGGFTQVCLEKGAKKVYAIDVGKEQLHPELKNNPKIKSFEETHILDQGPLQEEVDFICIDLSFISLNKVLPHIEKTFCHNFTTVLALFKPQFQLEYPDPKIIKKGIIKNEKHHLRLLEDFKNFLTASTQFKILEQVKAPIKGKKGNQEYLLLMSLNKN